MKRLEQSDLDTVKPRQAESLKSRRGAFVRWVIGVPLVLFSFPVLLVSGLAVLTAPFLVAFGCILIAPEIAGFFADRLGDMLLSRKDGVPAPMYGIPESLVAQGKYGEAEDEYERIVEEFPDEAKAHIGLVNIAVMRMNDKELAEKLYHRGLRKLQSAESKNMLSEMYNAVVTRLNSE